MVDRVQSEEFENEQGDKFRFTHQPSAQGYNVVLSLWPKGFKPFFYGFNKEDFQRFLKAGLRFDENMVKEAKYEVPR